MSDCPIHGKPTCDAFGCDVCAAIEDRYATIDTPINLNPTPLATHPIAIGPKFEYLIDELSEEEYSQDQIDRILNEYGASGWELVCVQDSKFYFKRVKYTFTLNEPTVKP